MKKSLLLIALSFGLFGCEKDVREPQLLDGALYVVGDVNGCINGNGYGTEIRTELDPGYLDLQEVDDLHLKITYDNGDELTYYLNGYTVKNGQLHFTCCFSFKGSEYMDIIYHFNLVDGSSEASRNFRMRRPDGAN